VKATFRSSCHCPGPRPHSRDSGCPLTGEQCAARVKRFTEGKNAVGRAAVDAIAWAAWRGDRDEVERLVLGAIYDAQQVQFAEHGEPT